jgi:hypothetical protein
MGGGVCRIYIMESIVGNHVKNYSGLVRIHTR